MEEAKSWFIIKFIQMHPYPEIRTVQDIFKIKRTLTYHYFKKAKKKPVKRLTYNKRIKEQDKLKKVLEDKIQKTYFYLYI